MYKKWFERTLNKGDLLKCALFQIVRALKNLMPCDIEISIKELNINWQVKAQDDRQLMIESLETLPNLNEVILSRKNFKVEVSVNGVLYKTYHSKYCLVTDESYGLYKSDLTSENSQNDVFYKELNHNLYSKIEYQSTKDLKVIEGRPFYLPIVAADSILLPGFDINGEMELIKVKIGSAQYRAFVNDKEVKVEHSTEIIEEFSWIKLKYEEEMLEFIPKQKMIISGKYVRAKTVAGLCTLSILNHYLWNSMNTVDEKWLNMFSKYKDLFGKNPLFLNLESNGDILFNEAVEALFDDVTLSIDCPVELAYIKMLVLDGDKLGVKNEKGLVYFYEEPKMIKGSYRTTNTSCAFLSAIYSVALKLYALTRGKWKVDLSFLFCHVLLTVGTSGELVYEIDKNNQITIKDFTIDNPIDADILRDNNMFFTVERKEPTKDGDLFEIQTEVNGITHYVLAENVFGKYQVLLCPAGVLSRGTIIDKINLVKETNVSVLNKTMNNKFVRA